jgi:hypothetical protein
MSLINILRLELLLKYTIPNISIEPDLEVTQKAVKIVAFNCVEVAKSNNK